MKLLTALLEELFGSEQAGGETMAMTIQMTSPTLCSGIHRFSTAGAQETSISFKPALPLDEALLHARKYTERGTFIHEQTRH